MFLEVISSLLIHKAECATRERMRGRLEKPLVSEVWWRSGAKTNLEGWSWSQVPDENKISFLCPSWCLRGHGRVAPASPNRNPSPGKNCLCQRLQKALSNHKRRGYKVMVRSWGLGPEQAPTSVTLGLGPKGALSPQKPHLAKSCYLLSLQLLPSTMGPFETLIVVGEEPSSAVKLGAFQEPKVRT